MSSDDCPPGECPIRMPLRIKAYLVILFLLVVLVTHGGSLHGPFLFDDEGAIVGNTSIHIPSLTSLPSALWGGKFTTVTGRPFLNLTFALNYLWGGLRPEGYHLANYFVHVGAAFVLFSLLHRVLAQFDETRTAAIPLALGISLLWCVHPLTINGVSYICQRAEAISSGFYLIVLWAFVKGVQTSHRRWFLLSVFAAWLGGLTKEIIATVPMTVILLDVLIVTRDWRKALRQHWRVYLGLMTSWIPLGVCMWASKSRDETVGYGMGVTLQEHVQTQVWAIARYLQLTVWPRPLIFDYGDRFVVSDSGQIFAAIVVCLAFGSLTVWLLVRKSPWAFSGVALCLLLAPTSAIPITTQTVAEHRMYLASACLIAALVLGAYLALARLHRVSVATRSVTFGVLLASVAVMLSLTTARHTRSFLSGESIWADTFQKHPTNQRAAYNLAIAKFNRKTVNDDDVALRLCDEVIGMTGDYVAGGYELRGLIFARRGEHQMAVDNITQAIALRPGYSEYYQNRAKSLRDLGRHNEALRDLHRAMSINPNNIYADLIRGSIYTTRGEFTLALECFDRLLEKDPHHGGARIRRARVYARLDRWQDALQEIQRLRNDGRAIDEAFVREVEQHLSSRVDVAM